MTLKKTTSETGTHSPVADILNTVSGAYCSEFWDGVYEVSGTLNMRQHFLEGRSCEWQVSIRSLSAWRSIPPATLRKIQIAG